MILAKLILKCQSLNFNNSIIKKYWTKYVFILGKKENVCSLSFNFKISHFNFLLILKISYVVSQ